MESNESHSSTELKQVALRKISSMDGGKTFDSVEEKLRSRRQEPGEKIIRIPKYPPCQPYKTNRLKRLWSRVNYFLAILKQRLSSKDYPVIAIIVVNNKCNWNCSYCFGDYPNRREIDYKTDEIKYLVDRLYKMGVRYINVHGGETLLRPDVGEICAYIKQKGMYLCVITNGSLLEKKLDELRCVDNLTISLDGAREGNDANRGKGTYEITVKAIQLALDAKIPLRVQATLTRHTMNDVGYLAKLANRMNFHLQFSILFKPLKQAQDSQMTNAEIRATLDKIRYYKNKGYPVFTSESSLRAAYEWPFDYNVDHHVTDERIPQSYREHHVKCFYSRTKFTIEADGHVYPCFLTTDGSFKPKNWRTVGIESAIEHVQKTNRCVACPALTQNDHNLLLGLNLGQTLYLIRDQIKETFSIRNRVK